jgi:hypothetical protein
MICALVCLLRVWLQLIYLWLQGVSHQIRNAWKWYISESLVRTCYSRYLKNLTLPFIFKGPLKLLSILHQTQSNSLSYWNLNSVYTRYIPFFSFWLVPLWCIYLVLQDSCSRCIPTVMRDDLGGVGMSIVFPLAIVWCIV